LNKKRGNIVSGIEIKKAMPGVAVALIIAVISFITWWFLRDTWLKFSCLLWSFVFSIVIANLLSHTVREQVLTRDRFFCHKIA
jgi:predicted neutral ceramidase superfamily lipid hydrolase